MQHLTSRYLYVAIIPLILLTYSGSVLAAPLGDAPPPLSLLSGLSPVAQMDDPELIRELAEEESLVDLQEIEFSRESLSVSRGVILSFIPGGGWSLIYGNRKAQGLLMILGASIGYGMGLAYLSGAFDEEGSKRCIVTDSSPEKASIFVGMEYCNPASLIHPTNARATMPARDPYLYKQSNSPTLNVILRNDQPPPNGYQVPYFSEVSNFYKEQTRGSDYDGSKTGQMIILGTYAATTIVSAIWSTVEIREQNKELRKRIESTAQGPRPERSEPRVLSELHPTFTHDGEQSVMGLSGQF